ncbi:hypothetical protein Tco_0827925 [Tanacetum coccineum]
MSYDDIRPIFEKVEEEDIKPEQIVKEVSKKFGGRRRKSLARKRARETLDEETSKKQKLDEEEATDYEKEKEELRMWLTVVPDEEEIVDPEILHTKYPIVDWESQSLGSEHVYKIIRADGNTSYHKTFESMLKIFNRQDLVDLHRLVMKRFEDNTLEGYNLMLWGDLKIMFEPNAEHEQKKTRRFYAEETWDLRINHKFRGGLLGIKVFYNLILLEGFSTASCNIEMDLFAFIRHSDPTKVRIGEREREPAEREVKLLKLIEGRTVPLNPPASAGSGDSGDNIDKLFDDGGDAGQEHSVERDDDVLEETVAKDVSEVVVEKNKKSKRKRETTEDASVSTFPPKKLREDYHAVTSNTGGKSLATIRSLVSEGSSVPSEIAEPRDDGSQTPCPDSIYGPVLPPRDTPVMTIAVTTTIDAEASVVQVSKNRVRPRNLETFRDFASAGGANVNAVSSSNDLMDRLASPALFSQLHSMDYYQLYTKFNVGAARKMCLGAEVRMRAEHTLEQKDRLEDKCAEQTALLSEKDAEIAHLRSLLSLEETEAAEAIRLFSQLSVVEATDAAKSVELRDLKERNFALEGDKDALSEKVATLESVTTSKETELASLTAQVVQLISDLSGFQLSRDELSSKVAFLESERDRLADQRSSLESAFELFKGRMEAMQDEQATVLGNRVAKLDAQLLEMAPHLDEEFYPRFLTTISGRQWILTHGLKLVLLKCLQSS